MIKVINGNSIEELKKFPDNYFGSVVTDPPYGLSFMGKKWDYDVPSVELWKEVFRVLKEGGHLLAFAGTRTQHRMAVNIEDAGFEIRDMIAWVYGSGFPKSHNIGKAVDKITPRLGLFDKFANHFLECMDKKEMKAKDFVSYFPNYKNNESIKAQISNWKLGKNVPSKEDFNILKPLLNLSDEFTELINRAEVEREIIREEKEPIKTGGNVNWDMRSSSSRKLDKGNSEWEGWGTALKPALEPITMARKPFKTSVAENVLKNGVGGINIDECRVGNKQGRFPANFIHDGSDEVKDLFPNTASRFFYCAKASKQDRNEGLEDFEDKKSQLNSGGIGRKISVKKRLEKNGNNTPTTKNIHPTVKPTDLMRYLVRLVTPKNEIVLDCFMGSGSTGKACALEGLSFVGIDLDKDYCKIAKARIDKALEDKRINDSQTKLF